MSRPVAKIAVIGAGAWGTALAANAAGTGQMVSIWARREDTADEINQSHTNAAYLADVSLPESVKATSNLAEACANADILLLCVPAQTIAATMAEVAKHAAKDAVFVSCAKGIDRHTSKTMSETIKSQASGRAVGVLSGPSFADDVVRFLPTAVTVAMDQMDQALDLCRTLSNRTLRCYASADMAGVDIGGALKNVLAIAVGIARGRRLGASAEAALIARGFAEMTRVGVALGAKPETMAGLSGLGDLVLTCSSPKSRNFSYGVAIGEGHSLEGLKLAEGAHTASIAAEITRRERIESPLIDAVTEVLENRIGVDQAIATLLARPIKGE